MVPDDENITWRTQVRVEDHILNVTTWTPATKFHSSSVTKLDPRLVFSPLWLYKCERVIQGVRLPLTDKHLPTRPRNHNLGKVIGVLFFVVGSYNIFPTLFLYPICNMSHPEPRIGSRLVSWHRKWQELTKWKNLLCARKRRPKVVSNVGLPPTSGRRTGVSTLTPLRRVKYQRVF